MATGVSSFAVLPSNIAAIKAALEFVRTQRQFVVLQGACGWGKTHLLRAATELCGGPRHDVYMASADEWLNSHRLHDRAGVLVLDDIHLSALRPRSRQLLQMELERRVRARRPTLCAMGTNTRFARRKLLPYSRIWQYVTIVEPTPDERQAIVRQVCLNEGIDLSEDLSVLLAKLVQGDGHSLIGAVKRLKLGMEKAPDSTMHPVRLVGLVQPHLQIDCDIRDMVLDAVTQSSGRNALPSDRDASKLTAIAVYILSRLAMISEESIASYFGMKQGDVYKLGQKVAQRLELPDMPLRSHLDRVLNLIASNLCEN